MTEETCIISIDLRSGVPLYRQIIDRVVLAIAAGDLKPGARLPTVRKMAIDLQVNPNTVSRAYREMEIRGILKTQRGTGTFVAPAPSGAEDSAKRREFLETFCEEFVAEATKLGFSVKELVETLQGRLAKRS